VASESSSKTVAYAVLAGNVLVAATKFVAAAMTGGSAIRRGGSLGWYRERGPFAVRLPARSWLTFSSSSGNEFVVRIHVRRRA